MGIQICESLLQVLGDNAFRRVEGRGLDHPIDLPVFVVVREVRLVVGLEVVDRPLMLLASPIDVLTLGELNRQVDEEFERVEGALGHATVLVEVGVEVALGEEGDQAGLVFVHSVSHV